MYFKSVKDVNNYSHFLTIAINKLVKKMTIKKVALMKLFYQQWWNVILPVQYAYMVMAARNRPMTPPAALPAMTGTVVVRNAAVGRE